MSFRNCSILYATIISKTLYITGNIAIGLIAPTAGKQLFSLEIVMILAVLRYVGTLPLLIHMLNCYFSLSVNAVSVARGLIY